MGTDKCCTYDRAEASAVTLKNALQNTFGIEAPAPSLYAPTIETSNKSSKQFLRLQRSDSERGTVLYLAYGSNLSIEKFRGDRGIRPLSQINVQVPSLRLTFDLPGLPYTEPCFANSGRRDPERDRPWMSEKKKSIDGAAPGQSRAQSGYDKDNWHKGLVGVVYEVTPSDYAHIIATEGGGSGYQDILVDCYPFQSSDPTNPVPQDPDTKPFKAHTLFAPTLPEDGKHSDGGRFARPDPSYAQASARYLKLITDGAAELGLPNEYQNYLRNIRPFTITTTKQRLGQFVFTTIWMPIILFVFALGRMFADEHGLSPDWLRKLSAAIFRAVWISYDGFFKPLFGEGERSIPDGGSPDVWSRIVSLVHGPRSEQERTLQLA